MKKVLSLLCILMFAGVAFADGDTVFTPLDFSNGNAVSSGATSAPVTEVSETEAVGNGNIQNAILQLDNAQVDIRTELQNYRAKYADVDAQYKLIKAERASLNKQVKSIERRIKNIEKAKEKIRKNML